ncbi:MAG: hypothetical protein LBJ72_05050 [Dysgonamonadaceae bacterium]|nr:hypothetical protein [Dysgonamonadaceae bacterium]
MKQILFLLCIIALSIPTFAQQIDLGNTQAHFSKGNLLKLSGNFLANSVFYSGNEPYTRDPFNYYFTGSVNLNVMNLANIPFTFNFTNSGSNYTYPTMPNRFSLHPNYKWITGHFGDVSMNFSPYTLNGHLFTGIGFDIGTSTNSPLKIGAMYGRMQQAVEYGTGNQNVPAGYKRMGYGTQIRFEKSKYQIGASLFTAKDDINSLNRHPDSLFIFPEENLAVSLNGNIQLIENMRLNGEYGVSILNNDIRRNDMQNSKFHAIRLLLDYTFGNNTIGIGYERIDPGYKTLGAYYFNNDMENITLNYARPFLKNKGNIALSGGIEHDDLGKTKESQTRRFIASVNIAYTPLDNLNLNLGYSSFQTHMNLKSQFDYINALTPYDNLDTLNYTQISQNIVFTTNYTFKKNETNAQNLNFNISLQEAVDKQGDIVPEGGMTLFCNTSLGYGFQYLPRQIAANVNLNLSTTQIAGQEMLIRGATFNVTVPLLDKKLNTTFIVSHNANYVEGNKQSTVWNLRFNAGYTLMKKHRFNLSVTYRDNFMQANMNKLITNGLTIISGYNYSF